MLAEHLNTWLIRKVKNKVCLVADEWNGDSLYVFELIPESLDVPSPLVIHFYRTLVATDEQMPWRDDQFACLGEEQEARVNSNGGRVQNLF